MSSLPVSLQRNPGLDTWIEIDCAETIIVRTGKAELGQGLRGAIGRIAAEELDVALGRIRVQTADTAHGPHEDITSGSRSLEQSGRAMRQAAAEARAALLELAGTELGVPASELRVVDGTIHAPDGGRTDYWRLLGGRRFDRTITGAVSPKPAEEHRIVGRPDRRLDLRGVVTGTTRYVADLIGAGVLFGRVVRPPGAGAELLGVAVDPVAAMDGVLAVVRDGSFLGVVAEREEQADRAAERLRRSARWSEASPLPDPRRLHAWLRHQPTRDLLVLDGTPAASPVPPIAAPPEAELTLRATYTKPYTMHASIGPSAARARWDGGELRVWSATQAVDYLQEALAAAFDLGSETVRVSHVEGPGCYGHNGADDVSLDAALLARAVPGRSVLVRWSREDEHAWEPYGPPMVVELQASLDGRRRVIDYNHDVWSNAHSTRPMPGTGARRLLASAHREGADPPPPTEPRRTAHVGSHRNADPLYAFPRRRVVKHFVEEMPIRVSALRSLGAYANVFAIESFMDELAAAAGADPLEFRLAQLGDERAREVLEAAAARAGWAQRGRDAGEGMGIGFARYKNVAAYAAVIVTATVDDATAQVRLRRAVIAADAGEVVDPDGLENQLEGGFVQSASWTLKESVGFDRTGITSRDWRTYPILTFSELPEIETVLLDRPGLPFLGAGEATQGPTAAAIANAIADAAGLRVRELPCTPDRLRAVAERAWALENA